MVGFSGSFLSNSFYRFLSPKRLRLSGCRWKRNANPLTQLHVRTRWKKRSSWEPQGSTPPCFPEASYSTQLPPKHGRNRRPGGYSRSPSSPTPTETCSRKRRTGRKAPFRRLTVVVTSFSISRGSECSSAVVLRDVFFNLNSVTKVLTENETEPVRRHNGWTYTRLRVRKSLGHPAPLHL